MARLDNKTVPGPWDQEIPSDYDAIMAHFQQQQAALEKLLQAAAELPEGEVVGAILSFPVGDGAAYYRVSKAKPLTLQHIPYGDGWSVHPALVRGIRKEDVLGRRGVR